MIMEIKDIIKEISNVTNMVTDEQLKSGMIQLGAVTEVFKLRGETTRIEILINITAF